MFFTFHVSLHRSCCLSSSLCLFLCPQPHSMFVNTLGQWSWFFTNLFIYISHVLWHKRKTPQIKTDLLGLLKENKTRAVCRCHWRLQDASTIESPAGFTQQSAVRENNALKINKTKYKFCSNIFKNKSKLLQEYYSEAEDHVCWDWVSLHVLSGLGVRGLTFKKTKNKSFNKNQGN